jgi:uncharacterized protein (DUF3084 family)
VRGNTVSSPSPHWLFWRCRFADCARNIRVKTRTGEKLTCPHCKRSQDGPTAIFRRLEAVESTPKEKAKEAAKVEPAKATKVTVNSPREPVKLVVGNEGIPREPAPSPPPPVSPPAKKAGVIDRILFG